MTESKRLKLNTFLPLIDKTVGMIYTLIIPRMFILCYGSDVNGLINSIGNFLSVLALMDMGIGAVVQSSLYKPLTENDNDALNRVLKSGRRFFDKITAVFFAYSIVLCFAYPIVIKKDFSFTYEALLVLILAVSSFTNSYLGITNNLLIAADSKMFINSASHCLCTVFCMVLSYFLIGNKTSVHIVETVVAGCYLIRPLIIGLFVHHNYKINYKVELNEEPIKQKWNGIAQHLAYYVTTNTDVVVLTFFSSLSTVSVYSVYNMVATGVSGLLIVAQSAFPPVLGKLIAKNKQEELKSFFERYEFLAHFITTIVYACTVVLVVPFVSVYLKNANDANYIQPLFSFILISAMFVYTLRFPYHSAFISAGHFKQTQMSSVIEMLLNIIITFICVSKLGLVGVAIGTFVSLAYRTVYLILYMPNIINEVNCFNSIKLLVTDIIIYISAYLIGTCFSLNQKTYFSWFLLGIKIFAVVVCISILVNMVVNSKALKRWFSRKEQ